MSANRSLQAYLRDCLAPGQLGDPVEPTPLISAIAGHLRSNPEDDRITLCVIGDSDFAVLGEHGNCVAHSCSLDESTRAIEYCHIGNEVTYHVDSSVFRFQASPLVPRRDPTVLSGHAVMQLRVVDYDAFARSVLSLRRPGEMSEQATTMRDRLRTFGRWLDRQIFGPKAGGVDEDEDEDEVVRVTRRLAAVYRRPAGYPRDPNHLDQMVVDDFARCFVRLATPLLSAYGLALQRFHVNAQILGDGILEPQIVPMIRPLYWSYILREKVSGFIEEWTWEVDAKARSGEKTVNARVGQALQNASNDIYTWAAAITVCFAVLLLGAGLVMTSIPNPIELLNGAIAAWNRTFPDFESGFLVAVGIFSVFMSVYFVLRIKNTGAQLFRRLLAGAGIGVALLSILEFTCKGSIGLTCTMITKNPPWLLFSGAVSIPLVTLTVRW